MQLTPEFFDEIRRRVRISEIIGRRVNLRSSGMDEYSGLCPFHKEKTPSFTVSDRKEFYHCFGCGAHGDIFGFITQIDGKPFMEVVKDFASQVGMEMPKEDPAAIERYQKRQPLYEIMENAAKFFQSELQKSSDVLQYLDDRKLSPQTVAEFRLGYAPKSQYALKNHLISTGATEEQLLDCGLIIKPENSNRDSYDRYRDRLIFPITNDREQMVGFGGRLMSGEGAKYINSPATDLFHKGQMLYNMYKAKEASYASKQLIVVEGYMDVIALHQAGIKHAVAPLGTALTPEQMQNLWRVNKNPTLCFDGDKAGQNAMFKAAERMLPIISATNNFGFLSLPTGQDPDDIIKEYGVEEFYSLLNNQTITLSKLLWKLIRSKNRIDNAEGKARATHMFDQLIGKIEDYRLKYPYRKYFRSQLYAFKDKSGRLSDLSIPDFAVYAPFEKALLQCFASCPSLLEDSRIEEQIIGHPFSNPEYQRCFDAMLEGEIKVDSFDFLKKSTPIEEDLAIILFRWLISEIHALDLENEYKNSMESESPASLEELEEIKIQLDELKKLAKKEKIAYEALLESELI